jgi:hypothetical protein
MYQFTHFVFHQLSFIHKLKNVVIMSPGFMPRVNVPKKVVLVATNVFKHGASS